MLPGIDELVADLIGTDESAAETAVSGLAEGGEPAAAAMLHLLGSADAEHRWWAVRVLAAMQAPPTSWLLRALGDTEADVRAAAALALGAHPDETAATLLVRALGDEDSLVAILAVNALVKIGGAAVPLLIDSFVGAPRRRQIHIMRALAELRDPRGIRLMFASLEQHSAALQYWAQEGLERLGLNMIYLKPD
ncbi:MAG: HEAT repeat domain-containing protein [Chloroflexota bacterium]